MARVRTRAVALAAGLAVLILFAIALATVVVQGRRTPAGRPVYVALGSSFAAGAGLGPLERGSPILCARSVNGYPQQLARRRQIKIIDMSCGGAVARHLLQGGQFFQGPQERTITTETRLVTITVGGNDVDYVSDLSLLAARRTDTLFGRLVRLVWNGPRDPISRHYDRLDATLSATLRAVHAAAPAATVVLATYPAILPRSGTCARLGIDAAEADRMRRVGDTVAGITRSVARRGGAVLVDMHVVGAAHDACAAIPWTRGWTNGGIAPFHPTIAGATATANAISAVLPALPLSR